MTRRPSSLQALDRRQLLIGSAASLLSGCAILSGPKVPQLYVLRPELPPAMGMGAPVRWRLTVGAPEAPASLDTSRIALSRSTTTMDYFANAAWTDRVPLMLQRMLIQAFDGSGRILSVDRDTSGTENDYLLETEIRDFQAHYDTPNGAPQVQIGIQVKLVRMPQREIISGIVANHQAQATNNNIDNIVLAFDSAAGAAISQIVGWTLNQPPPA